MLLQSLDLKQKRIKFLELIAEGFSKKEAGHLAGFLNPVRDAYPLLQTAEAAEYIKKRIQLRIRSEIVPEALEIALGIMRNTKTSDRVRWSIIQTMLAYGADIVAPKAYDPDETKTPEVMRSEELRGFIALAESELAKRSSPVIEGVIAPSQDVDIFE